MLIKAAWAVLAAIHALPALAAFRPGMIAGLYGTQPGSVSGLLLHHRAALFLGVFVVCIWAMVRPEVRPLSATIVAISMVSFLAIYLTNGAPASLRTIAIADTVGIPFLILVAGRAFRLF